MASVHMYGVCKVHLRRGTLCGELTLCGLYGTWHARPPSDPLLQVLLMVPMHTGWLSGRSISTKHMAGYFKVFGVGNRGHRLSSTSGKALHQQWDVRVLGRCNYYLVLM